jgi:hypothetical protein
MTLNARALCTLADVKEELGLTVATYDTRLERLIHAVSDAIASYCGRSLHYDAAVAESVAGFGGTRLLLSHTPIVSITSITIDTGLLAATDYEIEDANAGFIYRPSGWSWTAREANDIVGDGVAGTEERSIDVVYKGGYVTAGQVTTVPVLARTLPYDIEDAAIQMVADRYRNPSSRIASERLLSAAVTYRDSDIPVELRSVLDKYKRVVQA